MDFTKYIVENAFVLIPVLYILGNILKSLQFVPDKYIPLGLLILGILLACALLGFNINSVIQGVLLVGVTVYSNQVVKQLLKNDSFIANQTVQATNEAYQTRQGVKVEASTTSIGSTVSEDSQGITITKEGMATTGKIEIKDNSINQSVQPLIASSKIVVDVPQEEVI